MRSSLPDLVADRGPFSFVVYVCGPPQARSSQLQVLVLVGSPGACLAAPPTLAVVCAGSVLPQYSMEQSVSPSSRVQRIAVDVTYLPTYLPVPLDEMGWILPG